MITLFKGFKYDNSYDYVKLFPNKQAQNNYFDSLNYETIDKHNYVRENNTINVALEYDYLENEGVNYISFDNGYREIFAFVIKKEYVRKNLTRIIYEVDVFQTYMFDITLQKSFVERKKCTIDEITDFDEGLEIGEHIVENDYTVFNKNSTWFAMFNGIKEQQLIFNDNGILTNVVPMPYVTSKPLTVINGIQYPMYFMPLYEESRYKTPIISDINPPQPKNVVNSARKLLGKPYIWGGNYPPLGNDIGTDCSGLIQWAFNDMNLLEQVGLGGRWTTYTMIEHATFIKDLIVAKEGDVIFSRFNSLDSSINPGYPEHVMLLSEKLGNNQIRIIEAQQEGVPILERVITFDSKTMEIRRMM